MAFDDAPSKLDNQSVAWLIKIPEKQWIADLKSTIHKKVMPITNHALSQFQSCLYISHCAFDNLRRALSAMYQALRLAVEPNTF